MIMGVAGCAFWTLNVVMSDSWATKDLRVSDEAAAPEDRPVSQIPDTNWRLNGRYHLAALKSRCRLSKSSEDALHSRAHVRKREENTSI